MAGAHRTRSARRGRRGRGRHCSPSDRQPYAWLGAGAITVGVGAALVGGAGAAHADAADSDSGSQSSQNSDDKASPAEKDDTSKSAERDSSPDRDADADSDNNKDNDNDVKEPSTSEPDGDRDTPVDTADDEADAESPSGADDPDSSGLDARDDDPYDEDEDETDSASIESDTTPAPPNDLESAVELTDVELTSSPTSDTDTPGQAAALLTLAGNARRETSTEPTTADTSAGEAAKEAADAQFNVSIGWIPGVGTVYNGISLISDLAEFSAAIGRGDTEDMIDEIGDMTVDAVGMIPVIGAPLAATLHQIRSAASGPPNTTPVAGGDSFTTEEDTPVTGNLLLNDSDAEGAPLTAGTKTNPSHGTVQLNPDGSFTYTPTANFHGIDTFTYTVSDGVKRATGTVTITVTPVADAPVAGADTVTLDEDTPRQITVLANDSDGDDDPLTIVDVTAAGFGDVTLGDDGTLTYTPDANYHGTDTFTYTITDGSGETSTATVALIINPINDAPVVTAPDLTVDEDVVVTGNLLEHATDADGDPLTVIIGTTATHGTVALNADGSFTYTPDAEYSGADTFTYTVTDAAGAGTTATVSLTIKAVNDAPIAGADTGTVDEDNAVVVAVLDNDSDIEGGSLSVVEVGTPGHGTAGIGDNGTVTYTPAVNFFGTDTFTYTVSDGQGGITVATVTITVNPINDAPVAAGDNFGVNQNTSLTGNVLGNDSDPDGDPLTVSLGAGPASGGVVLNPDGSFTYNPNGGFHGTDSFSYTVTDSTGATSTATASITVNYVAPPVRNELGAGQWLEIDKYLQSNNGRFRVYMQGDGNLVLYDEAQNHKALWSSRTNGQPGLQALMQTDGNLVLYAGPTGKWSSKTNGWNGARLVVQDDGNLVIYSGSTAVWDRHAGVLKNPPGPTNPSGLGKPLTNYQVTQRFGGAHTGIDLAAPHGTPVYAAADGIIYFEGWGTTRAAGSPRSNWMGLEAGISILIQHDSLGIYTGYAHLQDTVINQGQYVTKGQLIGHVGCTTRANACSGPHLHFEVLAKPLASSVGISGRINPAPYISL